MSTRDQLSIFGRDRARLCCAAGHPQDEFTVEGDGACETLYLFEGRLYGHAGREKASARVERLREGARALVEDAGLAASERTETLEIMTCCGRCSPVVSLGSERVFGTNSEHPRVEYAVEVRRGRVVRIAPRTLETRAGIRRRRLREGARVVDDRDPIARSLRR